MKCVNCNKPILNGWDVYYCRTCNKELCNDCWNEEEHDEHD